MYNKTLHVQLYIVILIIYFELTIQIRVSFPKYNKNINAGSKTKLILSFFRHNFTISAQFHLLHCIFSELRAVLNASVEQCLLSTQSDTSVLSVDLSPVTRRHFRCNLQLNAKAKQVAEQVACIKPPSATCYKQTKNCKASCTNS